MEEQRFTVARRGLVVANAAVAAFGLVFGVVSLLIDRPVWSGIAFLLLASVHGVTAFLFGRQAVVLTEEGIVATQGFHRHRVAWDEVERVHLDWSGGRRAHSWRPPCGSGLRPAASPST